MLEDTRIPAQRVALTDASGRTPSREWFRFFSNLFDFIGLGQGAVPPTSGGTGQKTYVKGDLLYAPADNTLARLPVPGEPCYLGTDATNMPQWIPVAYGAFYNTNTQTAPASTPTGITFNVTDHSRHITVSGSKITVAKTGLYNIIFSLQLTNDQATEDDAIVWLRVNGLDVPNSASHITVNKKHGSIDGNAILTVNLYDQLTAGEYFEIYGMSVLGYLTPVSYTHLTLPTTSRV